MAKRDSFNEEQYAEGEIDAGERSALISTKQSFGKKTITLAGSVVLISNNIMGPAVVASPLVYQQAGWVSATLVLIVSFFCSAFAATMLCEAMQRIPGNHNFKKRFEFATTMGHYFGRKGYFIGQILINICLQAANIASIIIAAQVMDDFLIFVFGHSYAVRFLPPFKTIAVTESTDKVFEGEEWVLSLGYVVSLVICLPFGYLNLDENMWFQWFSFIATMGTMVEFIIQFLLMHADYDWCPAIGSSGLKGQALVLGVMVFGWAFVITIPSWVNEKKNKVSVNTSVWFSSTFNLIFKILFGYLAAIVYQNPKQNANILNVMTASSTGKLALITRITVYIFNIGAIIPGIPVYSILVRYNLITGKLCGPVLAFVISVVFPWVLSAFFYHGSGFSEIVNWSAIIFQGVVNFILPALLYYVAVRRYPNPYWNVPAPTENSENDEKFPPVIPKQQELKSPFDTPQKPKKSTPEITEKNPAEHVEPEPEVQLDPDITYGSPVVFDARGYATPQFRNSINDNDNYKEEDDDTLSGKSPESGITSTADLDSTFYGDYVNAVPKGPLLPSARVCALIVLVVTTVLTVATLILDIGFLIAGDDIV